MGRILERLYPVLAARAVPVDHERQQRPVRLRVEAVTPDQLLPAAPGYHIEYVDRPVRSCGSGEVVELSGDGYLLIRLTPARAHTEEGNPTIAERERTLNLTILKQAKLICDFEAQVEWALGLSSPNKYRVLELQNPSRLVVDIKH